MTNSWSERKILQFIKKGGIDREQAISELYRDYGAKFERHFIGRHRIPAEDAREVVQDTFISIVKNCETFRGDGSLSAWLWRIAINSKNEYFRKQIRYEDKFTNTDEIDTHSDVTTNTHETLEDCVKTGFIEFARVDDKRAADLELAAIERWSMDEMAEYLGRSAGATREYISQCRKKIKEFLQDCLEYINVDAT